jgi:hypothetical protein
LKGAIAWDFEERSRNITSIQKLASKSFGLTRRPDGRWRIIGSHKTFREDNEDKANEKFYKLTKKTDETQDFLRNWNGRQLAMSID